MILQYRYAGTITADSSDNIYWSFSKKEKVSTLNTVDREVKYEIWPVAVYANLEAKKL